MTASLRLTIKELLIRELDLRGKTPEQIEDEAPLFGDGLGLDSLDALELAVALEQEFGVELPEGDAAKAVFFSVATLANYVEEKRGGSGIERS